VPKTGGFTITSAPSAALTGPSPYLELAVQASPENEPAAWLWRPVSEILGATLRVRVGGRFTFPPSSESSEHAAAIPKKVVFVAGGVGVNPLISMLSYIAEGHERDAVDVSFLYASKLPSSGSLSDIVFLDRITQFFGEGKVKGDVKLYVTAAGNTMSQETRYINGAQVEIQPRRLTVADVKAAMGGEDSEGTVVYVCGPPPMTDELVEKLAAVMDSRRVLTERWW
jgi:ferredoxin-NADP reductase